MALHRLTSITMGVPNVSDTAAHDTDFGLQPDGEGWFRTRDGGRKLRIVSFAYPPLGRYACRRR